MGEAGARGLGNPSAGGRGIRRTQGRYPRRLRGVTLRTRGENGGGGAGRSNRLKPGTEKGDVQNCKKMRPSATGRKVRRDPRGCRQRPRRGPWAPGRKGVGGRLGRFGPRVGDGAPGAVGGRRQLCAGPRRRRSRPAAAGCAGWRCWAGPRRRPSSCAPAVPQPRASQTSQLHRTKGLRLRSLGF